MSKTETTEERLERDEILRQLREEEEAELSADYLKSVRHHFITTAFENALAGKVDRKTFAVVFDKPNIDEKLAEFARFMVDEIAHQQAIVNEQFRNEEYHK